MAKVLLATADAALFDIMAAEVSGEGHDVLWAADGKEALELADTQSPELVLLDANLPVFNGIETCTALRENPDLPPGLPIIVLSDDAVPAKVLDDARATALAPKTHSLPWLREMLVEHLNPHRAH